MKATHYGHCQACGARQKLPNGVLSQHGYTKRWGFFEGICQGWGCLPFESSCDEIKKYIANTKEILTGLQRDLDRTNNNMTVGHLHNIHRQTQTFGAGHTVNTIDALSSKAENGGFFYHWVSDGRLALCENLVPLWTKTTEDARREAQVGWIRGQQSSIRQHYQYIQWQSERVAKWAKADLALIEV